MAFLGWGWVIYAFQVAENADDAARILCDALRSDAPLGSTDREDLARLIEGTYASNPIGKYKLEISPLRNEKRRNKDLRLENACSEIRELVANGELVIKATEIIHQKYDPLCSFEYLQRCYQKYKKAMSEYERILQEEF